MTKVGGILVVIVSLIAGFGGGAAYQAMYPTTAGTGAASTTTAATATTATKTLAECLTDVWGADKYAAITANASLATTEDNFSALTCYQSK